MHTGLELKEAREDAGLTQEQVAIALGLHRVTIANWEAKARIAKPKADRFLRVVRDLADTPEVA